MWISLCKILVAKTIQIGDLTLHYPDGTTQILGDGAAPHVEVFLQDPTLPRKIILNTDMAVGEAYMDGRLTITDDDLFGFLELGIKNRRYFNDAPPSEQVFWVRLQGWIHHQLRTIRSNNILERARKNVAHHYNLSDDLYDLFLDEDKQYSCAYFKTAGDTLEAAQAQKKHHIAKKLCLEKGMRVLDIGCGWGGLGLTLAREYGVKVVGVTLSESQHKIAVARAGEAGLDVDFRLQDYRLVDGQFDRIVSVGMFEHVGLKHHNEFFSHVYKLLNPEGVALIHTIGRNSAPFAVSSWIQKYIFPGGYLPSLSEITHASEEAALETMDIEILRLHYAETIKHWRARFDGNIEAARLVYDDRFCRMWRYYLAASETTFRFDKQAVFQVQLVRGAGGAGVVPLTRDYLYK